MTKTILPVSFFFGANNKNGYCSLYSQLYSPYEKGKHIIIKGGPGTGKSTLMKKIAAKLESKGLFTERGYCSADPNSLDVVYCPQTNFSILDGTAPHTFDPTLPGVYEHILDLSPAWNKNSLQEDAQKIGEKQKENKYFHKKAAEFLNAALSAGSESTLICSDYLDFEKLERYALRLAKRYIPKNKTAPKGKEFKRFLSGITPDGVYTQQDTVVALSENIITIEDEYGICSSFIAEVFAKEAIENGYDIYKCFCPLLPLKKAEHIIIPKLSLTLFTQNSFHNSITGDIKRIDCTRFSEKELLAKNKEKLRFLQTTKAELIDGAVKNISKALKVHDELEKYYINAIDFSIINEMGEKLLNQI